MSKDSSNKRSGRFERIEAFPPGLAEAARIAVAVSLKVKPFEQVLIISNPSSEVALLAQAIYDAVILAEGCPALIFQPVKTQLDFAEPAVIAAFSAKPGVCISLSAEKLGKDRQGVQSPYVGDAVQYDHILHYQLYGEKTCRSFWSPSVTVESFIRTVPIDYGLLKRRCAAVKAVLDSAVSARITAPGGTDIQIGLRGRESKTDDGDFSAPGSGGNLPAGETFISPENGTARGIIAFDGSISLHDRDMVLEKPIRCVVERGFITDIQGGEEARALEETVRLAEVNASAYEKAGTLPAGSGAVYARNARNIGELGIGLNPAARISGLMLEDEKAFHTCHFAIGLNYDGDAPSLIHLDGLVKNPTIITCDKHGNERIIEKDGHIQLPEAE
ncbi:MAG: peptidase M17 [Spirochaetaceae bacterium]|jgi:leucyl aminopeptidase (aminopeptidase T)|nr:peptidase M17 [Spirochaetaceae bacterium]